MNVPKLFDSTHPFLLLEKCPKNVKFLEVFLPLKEILVATISKRSALASRKYNRNHASEFRIFQRSLSFLVRARPFLLY